jgi:hypothetical protein
MLGRSPFEALYGRHPRVLGLQPLGAAKSKLADWLIERASMNQLIRQHLLHAQDHMKCQDGKKRSEREFEVGAMVYLKLQPYVQSSVVPRENQKLRFKYFGPFQILECIGSVAYCLQLPAHSSIHPVVHVSQLKLVAGFKGQVSSQLPSHSLEHHVTLQILVSRMVDHGASQVIQVLIKLSESPADLATWEDYEALKHTFLGALLESSRFPRGSVSVVTPSASKAPAQEADPCCISRPTKNNARVSSPEWIR